MAQLSPSTVEGPQTLIKPPQSDDEFYLWLMVLMVGYLLVAYLFSWCRGHLKDGSRFALNRIFDAATFSTSLLLLLGIVYPGVLTAIGNTKPFLIIAGLGGFVYSLHALWPSNS